MIERTTCTHLRRSGRDCMGDVPEGSPVTLCVKHLREAYRYFADCLEAMVEQGIDYRLSNTDWRHNWRPVSKDADPVVYYALVNGFIKIGVTRDLGGRLKGLMAEALLGCEPGDEEVERGRHHQFKHARAKGREWFFDCKEIRDHVAALPMLVEEVRVAADMELRNAD